MQASVAVEKNEVGSEDKLENTEKLHTDLEPGKDKPGAKLKGRLANTGLKIETKGDVKEETSAVLDCCLPKIKEGKAETVKPAPIKVSVEKDGKIENEIKPESKLMPRAGFLKTSSQGLGLEIQTKGQVSAIVSKLACCDPPVVPVNAENKNPTPIKVEIKEVSNKESAEKINERPRISLRDALSADKAGIDIKTKGEISNKVQSLAECCEKDKQILKPPTVVPKVELIDNSVEKPKVRERDSLERRERINPFDTKASDFVHPRQESVKDFQKRDDFIKKEDTSKPISRAIDNKVAEVPTPVRNTFEKPKYVFDTQERNNPRLPTAEAPKHESGLNEKDLAKLAAQHETHRKSQEAQALFKQKIITEAAVIRDSLKKRDGDSQVIQSSRKPNRTIETATVVYRTSSDMKKEHVLPSGNYRMRDSQPDKNNISINPVQAATNHHRINSSAFKSEIRGQNNVSSSRRTQSSPKKRNTDIVSHSKLLHLTNGKNQQSQRISTRAKISNKIKLFTKKLYLLKLGDSGILKEKGLIKRPLSKISRQLSLEARRIKKLASNKVLLNIRKLYLKSNLHKGIRQNSLRARYKKLLLRSSRLIGNFRQNKINSRKFKNRAVLSKKIRLLQYNRLSMARNKLRRFREKLQKNGILLISRDKKVRHHLAMLKRIIQKLSDLNLKKDSIIFKRRLMLAIRRKDMRSLKRYLGRFSLRYQMILKELSTEELRFFLMLSTSGKRKKRRKLDALYISDEDSAGDINKKPL